MSLKRKLAAEPSKPIVHNYEKMIQELGAAVDTADAVGMDEEDRALLQQALRELKDSYFHFMLAYDKEDTIDV